MIEPHSFKEFDFRLASKIIDVQYNKPKKERGTKMN